MNDVIWNSIQMNGSYYSAEPIQMDIPGTNLIAECKFHSTFRMQLTITGDGKKMFENFYSPFQTDISFHGDIAVRIGAGKMALLVCFDLIHDRVGTVSSTMFIYDLKNFQLKWTGSVYAGSIYESDELIAFVLDQQNQKKYVVLDINQPEKISELVSHPLKQVTEKKDVEAGIKDTNLSATELKKNHEYAQKQKENQKEIKNTIASPESHQLINEQACTELENSRKLFAFRITRNKKLRFVFLIIAFTGMALLHPFFGEKLGFDSSFMMIIALVLIITGSIVFIILNYQLRNKLTIPVAENIKLNREVIAPVLNRQFDSAQLIEKNFPFEYIPQDSVFEPFDVPIYRTVNKSPYYYQCKIKDLNFLFSYVKLDYKCKSDSDELLKRFHGILLLSPLHQRISFTVHVRDLSLKSMLSRSITPDKIQSLTKIDLVDPVFTKLFEVWTDNPAMARFIVNPKEMEELMRLREIAEKPVEFFVNGYNQFLLIHENENPLEISIKRKIDVQFVNKLHSELEKMATIIKLAQVETPKHS